MSISSYGGLFETLVKKYPITGSLERLNDSWDVVLLSFLANDSFIDMSLQLKKLIYESIKVRANNFIFA